jgi:hypothetical protein
MRKAAILFGACAVSSVSASCEKIISDGSGRDERQVNVCEDGSLEILGGSCNFRFKNLDGHLIAQLKLDQVNFVDLTWFKCVGESPQAEERDEVQLEPIAKIDRYVESPSGALDPTMDTMHLDCMEGASGSVRVSYNEFLPMLRHSSLKLLIAQSSKEDPPLELTDERKKELFKVNLEKKADYQDTLKHLCSQYNVGTEPTRVKVASIDLATSQVILNCLNGGQKPTKATVSLSETGIDEALARTGDHYSREEAVKVCKSALAMQSFYVAEIMKLQGERSINLH